MEPHREAVLRNRSNATMCVEVLSLMRTAASKRRAIKMIVVTLLSRCRLL